MIIFSKKSWAAGKDTVLGWCCRHWFGVRCCSKASRQSRIRPPSPIAVILCWKKIAVRKSRTTVSKKSSFDDDRKKIGSVEKEEKFVRIQHFSFSTLQSFLSFFATLATETKANCFQCKDPHDNALH